MFDGDSVQLGYRLDAPADDVKLYMLIQTGFSANLKTITTTDEMLAEVINLKR